MEALSFKGRSSWPADQNIAIHMDSLDSELSLLHFWHSPHRHWFYVFVFGQVLTKSTQIVLWVGTWTQFDTVHTNGSRGWHLVLGVDTWTWFDTVHTHGSRGWYLDRIWHNPHLSSAQSSWPNGADLSGLLENKLSTFPHFTFKRLSVKIGTIGLV